MKKFFTTVFAAVALVAAPMLLTSCGNEDEPEPGDKTVVLKTPKYKSEARLISLGENEKAIRSIELTESGEAIIIYERVAEVKATRGVSGTHAVCGAYVVVNNLIKVTVPGEAEITVSDDQTVTVGDKSVKIESVEKGGISTDSDKMFRTWNINKTCKIDGIRVDLSKRKEFAETGHPTKFIMTKAGTFAVQFSKGGFEAGTYHSTPAGEFYVEGLESYKISSAVFAFAKVVTLGCNIDGTTYEIYLESAD